MDRLWFPYGTLFTCQRSSRRDEPALPRQGPARRPAAGAAEEIEMVPDARGNVRYDGEGFPPRRSLVVLRKEVIQPQVLLRLPCYDLVPIIELTFGDFPPCGLDHRLRVLPTLVA